MSSSKEIKQNKKTTAPKTDKESSFLLSNSGNYNEQLPKSDVERLTSSKRRRIRRKKSSINRHTISDEIKSASNINSNNTIEVKVSNPSDATIEVTSINLCPANCDAQKYPYNNSLINDQLNVTSEPFTQFVYSLPKQSISTIPVTNLVNSVMSQSNNEKTKEQIQADRKLKKSMKQSTKKQNSKTLEGKPEISKTQPSIQTKIEKSVTSEEKREMITNAEPIKSSETPSVPSNETEKSRDAIKAEREAKKLAKQARKIKQPNESTINEKPIVGSQQLISSDKVTGIPINQKNDTLLSNKVKEEKAEEKSKAELKAERRAKQEAQRAAKEASKGISDSSKEFANKVKTTPITTGAEINKMTITEKPKTKVNQNFHKVKLFNHLYAEKERPAIPVNFPEIHKAIIRLGVQYASHTIIGSNARCIALLNALKEVVRDYSLPPNVEFSRGFEAHLAPCLKFLNSCRPHAVSMNNALKHIKWQLTQLPNNSLENNGKSKLCDAIDVYIKDQIEVAGKAISIAVTKKIANDDIILTYGCSSLIENILVDAAAEKNFRVVVVEAHPWKEGKEMLRRLTARGIKCSLVMISALSFVMREINKVVLGAGALLANGYVMARAGTAQVAMVAHAHNVPVLVCCETHKFSERVQTDSFVYNEIGDPDELINCNSSNVNNPLVNWRSYNMLSPLNLFYDVTPPDLVTAVVTELAVLPCTSVPVILRMKPSEFM